VKHRKTEFFSSFLGAALFLADSVADGWRLDKDNPPDKVGFSYVVALMRDDEPVVRLTRAEILAKARAAKTEKSKEAKINGT
jgi:hypothetical protein